MGMPAHSRSKNGVAGSRVFSAASEKTVDGRDKPGHDELPVRALA
jgi:hypothetical protein